MNGVVSLLALLDRDETVRLLLLLLDSDKVRMLDLNERPDSDPAPDPAPEPADLILRPVFVDCPDLSVSRLGHGF